MSLLGRWLCWFMLLKETIGWGAISLVNDAWVDMSMVFTLWLSEAIWHQRTWSALAQIRACCQAVPTHYLNRCWIAINRILRHLFQGTIYLNTQVIDTQVVFEIYTFEITTISPWGQWVNKQLGRPCTVYPTKYAHGFVVLCFVVVMQSFIMNSHEVFIHIHQGCFAGTGAI